MDKLIIFCKLLLHFYSVNTDLFPLEVKAIIIVGEVDFRVYLYFVIFENISHTLNSNFTTYYRYLFILWEP